MNIDTTDILAILNTYKSRNLKDLGGSSLMNRVDTKFIFKVSFLNEILLQLLEEYDILEIENKFIHTYESLYFDTPELNFHLDHHNNRLPRNKLRIRKYVETNTYFFEVKKRKRKHIEKNRIPCAGFTKALNTEQLAFVKKLNIEHTSFIPTQKNSYKRITLVHKNRKERLTLDFDLNFYWEDKERKFRNIVIAELKQEKMNRNVLFFNLMKLNGFPPYRISKYCTGIYLLNNLKDIKYNRFKEKIRKLEKLDSND